MNLELIRGLAFRSMGQRYSHPDREPGYAYYHGQRVGKIALQLRKLIFPGQEQDDEVILIGGWFHDAGKGIEPHWEYGALITEQILRSHSEPSELAKIVEIVGGHTLRRQKDYPNYVQIVQDADILDHFGSQEIWLNFWHSAYKRQGLENSLSFYDNQYLQHIEKVRGLLNYPESVEFFDEKDQYVREFIYRFRQEAEGKLMQI